LLPEKKQKSVLEVDNQLLNDITELIHSESESLLKNILTDLHDFDISVIIDNIDETEDAVYLFSLLSDETASEVISELRDDRRDQILSQLSDEEISEIVDEMDSDDAADLVSELDEKVKDDVLQILETVDKEDSDEVRELLTYDENTAGGIMAKEFIAIHMNKTVSEAVVEIQEQAEDVDEIYNVWVVDGNNVLVGIISLKSIIMSLSTPAQKISEIMDPDVISVDANVDQEEVAKIFSSYDLISMPVVDSDSKVIGRISIDDVVDVIKEEYEEDVAMMVGSDAEELEKKSPFQVAKIRLPWILITLSVEMIVVFMIKSNDAILEKVILLAAFMPIISAISGNTGLQTASIVVRAMDTGYITLNNWFSSVKRQLITTLIIGFVVGSLVTIIGLLISNENRIAFGLTVGLSMFVSINVSGMLGTVFPLISKKVGFDPAITSGPFATAFQDVVGISIFLSIATYMLAQI